MDEQEVCEHCSNGNSNVAILLLRAYWINNDEERKKGCRRVVV